MKISDLTFGNNEYEVRVWNGEYLGKYCSLDTETDICPFHDTPNLVTVQVYAGKKEVYYVRLEDLGSFLDLHKDTILIMQNFSFDIDVMAKFLQDDTLGYKLIDRNLIRDDSILYRLYHLATRGYVPFSRSLAVLSSTFLGIELIKDERRENFAQFLGKPLEEIPADYLAYGGIDAIATYQIYQILIGQVNNLDKNGTMLSHDIQVKGEFALQRIYKNGIGFDLNGRDRWLEELDPKMELEADRLAMWGWVRGKKGIKDQYVSICEMIGIKDKLPMKYDKEVYQLNGRDEWVSAKNGRRIPKGKTPTLSSSTEDLTPYRDLDFVDAYIKFHELEKASSFVRDIHSSQIHPRYSSLLNTGRTSCSKPNIQQMPRVGGVRELFKPVDPNNVFVDIDYSSLELATLAQVNITENGYSKMGDLINDGQCLHYHTASSVYGKPKEEITKDERQFSKIPNFGFGANMAPSTFVQYCKGYGVDISEERAKKVKEAWVATYPEMKDFFNIGNNTKCVTLSGRQRANCSYTAYLNTKFQGHAADGFKIAMYEVCKHGYRIAAEIHDQLVVEVPRAEAEAVMPKIQRIMEKGMQSMCPDVKIATEGQIIERFTK